MFHQENASPGQSRGYATIAEAAAGFGADFYFFTRTTGRECAANLYSGIEQGELRYHYDNVRFGGQYCVALYVPNCWVEGGRTFVGCVHTHPPAPNGRNARFSGYDVCSFRRLLERRPEGNQFEAFLVPQEDRLIRFVDGAVVWEEEVTLPQEV